jgi:serine/threonine protein kinase
MSQDMPETFGRYRIVKLLGEGAMGTVYLARDTQLDRLVALKVPKLQERLGPRPGGANLERTAPQFDRQARGEERETPDSQTLLRFFREARAAAALNHPNICAIHDIGEIDGVPFLTMSYLEGRTLAEMVEEDGPMVESQAVTIVRTLARAMQEAHSRGVIHRDLKPSNVMMIERGEPVIMDFGIARRDAAADARLTKTGAILGTPAFMAPEQIEGNPDAVGRPCDIYSLGVILYELLTARLPFGGSVLSMLGKILYEPPDPPSQHKPDLDRTLEAVCLKALAKRPQDRYSSMADFAVALEEYRSRPPETTTLRKPDRSWARQVRRAPSGSWRRSRVLLAGGAMCGAVLLAGMLVLQGRLRTMVHATSARSIPARTDETDRRSVNGTYHQSAPSSSSVSTASSGPHAGRSEQAGPTVTIPGSLTKVKQPASAKREPQQKPASVPAPPTSGLAAALPAATPGPTRPGSGAPPPTLTNSIGVKLVLIPSGTFRMGSAVGEGEADEQPSHEVRISRPFYLGIHEITQGQYRAVLGNNPSWFSIESGSHDRLKDSPSDEHPAESITWFEAVRFCNELSKREGLKPLYAIFGPDVSVIDWTRTGYRLPTEAEWEYACRAGSETVYSFGNDPRELIRHAWFGEASAKAAHHVARKLANAWGLFDMHGNVGEWCWDWYDQTYYSSTSGTDPKGAAKGKLRVHRGGGFNLPASQLHSADRTAKEPTVRYGGLGFRVARNWGGAAGE